MQLNRSTNHSNNIRLLDDDVNNEIHRTNGNPNRRKAKKSIFD